MHADRWIQPQHLTAEAMAAHREQFERHRAKALQISSFLRPEVALALHRLLAEEASMELRHRLNSKGRVPEAEWLAAPPEDRFYSAYFMIGVLPAFRLSPNVVAYLKFTEALRGREFLDFFAQITGRPLDGADLTPRAMVRGQRVTPHIDDAGDRSLAFALYLSPGWRPEFGGAIQLFDAEGRAMRYEAENNSIVVFDATIATLHVVDPITEAAGDARRYSIGGWFYRPAGGPSAEVSTADDQPP